MEIIAGGPDPEYGPCLLNVDEVGAGSHEVVSMSMAGNATVRILDPSGAVIFEQAIAEHPAEGGATADLLVVPARPGYEEGGTGWRARSPGSPS